MNRSPRLAPLLVPLLVLATLAACKAPPPAKGEGGAATDDTADDPGPDPDLDFHGWAKGCYTVRSGETWLAADSGPGGAGSYGFTADDGAAARFTMQPSDLGTFLFYDQDAGYLSAEDGPLTRETVLQSDVSLVVDEYISGAEWVLERSANDGSQFQLRSRRNDQLLSPDGLTADEGLASAVTFEPAEGCVEYPELSLDATGDVSRTTFEDGGLYGIVDTHSHILSNFGFGGGIFHGGAYHRLGVEHALPDCDAYHGEMGRMDFFGYAFDSAGNNSTDLMSFVGDLVAGELTEDNHITDGYPDFTEWPDARRRATHQQQYYRWLERAHLAGLRLVVQHATTNSIICNLSAGEGYQPQRYDCEDMTSVDRIIDETYALEDYIDAQSGGPDLGWFRVVQTPAEARAVIADGKMAVILGIETSDLFRCNITPRADGPDCDETYINEQLDAYYARGVRALFPVHKYDNKFSPGDGASDFIELGNFLNSGHWTNMTEDCPEGVPGTRGDITFGGLQQPRAEYLAPAPNDLSAFPDAPIETVFGYVSYILEPSLPGSWCQNGTLTTYGEALIMGMMERGMIVELDHFSTRSYLAAVELLEQHEYPASGSHGRNFDGRIFESGGVSKIGLGRCQNVDDPGSTLRGYLAEAALMEEKGAYPAPGFGFDFNGFAGAHGPRFGDGVCSTEQENPITYPFMSYGDDVEFTQPYLGNRAVDYGTEGMIHVGMLPELLQDARADAVNADDLDPLFRSAEGYIRMWELAEARGAVLSAGE
jgi:microsomal dipeptidase-like Zn-dependent dipeptidase